MDGSPRQPDERWRVTLTQVAPDADPGEVARAGIDLLRRWSEPHRRYHTGQHLTEALAALDTIDATEELDPTDRAAAELALWFHDAVHDPAAADNEIRSAGLAGHVLTALGVSSRLRVLVPILVRGTAGHAALGGTPVGDAVHDADLWILSAPSARFDEYCRQVRAEYAHIADPAYGAGRRMALEPYLRAEPLYLTRAGATWERRAKVNLRREVIRLPR